MAKVAVDREIEFVDYSTVQSVEVVLRDAKGKVLDRIRETIDPRSLRIRMYVPHELIQRGKKTVFKSYGISTTQIDYVTQKCNSRSKKE